MIPDEEKIFHFGLRSGSKWLDHGGLLQGRWFYNQIFYSNSCFGKILSNIGDLPQKI